MGFNRNTGKLRDFRVYFLKALKFFDLREEHLAPIIFSVMLLVSFLGSFLPSPVEGMDITTQIDPRIIPLYILMGLVMKLALTIYLTGCIKDLRGEAYSFKSCLSLVLKRSLRVLIASAIYTMFTTVVIVMLAVSGFFYLALPVLAIYIMYMFNTCYIVDRNCSIIDSFKASRKLTSGYKWKIFVLAFTFSLIFILLSMLILGMFVTSGSLLIYSFVLYFVLSIFNLMNEKLVALIYYDLEYGAFDIEREQNDEF